MAVNCSDEVWEASCAAIVISTKNGEYDEARRAIHELGFPPDCEDQDGSTPLIAACSNNDPGSIEMVQYLLSVGANVNATNRTYNWTPLIAAAYAKNKDAIELLLNHKVRPKVRHRDKYQKNAVDYIREQVLRSIPMPTYIDAFNSKFTYVSQYCKVLELRNRGQYISLQDEDKYQREPPEDDEEPVSSVLSWTDTILRLEQARETEKPSLLEQRLMKEQKKAEEREANRKVETERLQKAQELRQKHQEGMQKFKEKIRAHASYARQTGHTSNVPDPVIVVRAPSKQIESAVMANSLAPTDLSTSEVKETRARIPTHAVPAQSFSTSAMGSLPPIHPATNTGGIVSLAKGNNPSELALGTKRPGTTINPLGIATNNAQSSFQSVPQQQPTTFLTSSVSLSPQPHTLSKTIPHAYQIQQSPIPGLSNSFVENKPPSYQPMSMADATSHAPAIPIAFTSTFSAPPAPHQVPNVANSITFAAVSASSAPIIKNSNVSPLYKKQLESKVSPPDLDLNISRFLHNMGHSVDSNPTDRSNPNYGASVARRYGTIINSYSVPSFSLFNSQEPMQSFVATSLRSPNQIRTSSGYTGSSSLLNTPGFSPPMLMRRRRGSTGANDQHANSANALFQYYGAPKSLENEFSNAYPISRLEPIGRRFADPRREELKGSATKPSVPYSSSLLQPNNFSLVAVIRQSIRTNEPTVASSNTFRYTNDKHCEASKLRSVINYLPRINKHATVAGKLSAICSVVSVVIPTIILFLVLIVTCLDNIPDDNLHV